MNITVRTKQELDKCRRKEDRFPLIVFAVVMAISTVALTGLFWGDKIDAESLPRLVFLSLIASFLISVAFVSTVFDELKPNEYKELDRRLKKHPGLLKMSRKICASQGVLTHADYADLTAAAKDIEDDSEKEQARALFCKNRAVSAG